MLCFTTADMRAVSVALSIYIPYRLHSIIELVTYTYLLSK